MSLQRISLRDFVIVRQLELEFGAGFTVLSGETGAGKSILIDALQLVLGARAEASVVREGAARSELCAEFSTPAHLHPWLQDNGFDAADDLLLKRSIDAQGKSRAWINGSPATATQLREIGDQLLDIHGQHAWQSLTRPSAVRDLLDAFAQIPALALQNLWNNWRQSLQTLEHARLAQDQLQQERERLSWQISEVDKLSPGADEWDELNAQHTRLSHAQTLLDAAQTALSHLQDEDAAHSHLAQAVKALQEQANIEAEFQQLSDQLGSALAQAEDAAHSLQAWLRRADLDPEGLADIDARMGLWLALSRRYKRTPQELPALYLGWQQELVKLDAAVDLAALEAAEQKAKNEFMAEARKRSQARQKAAPKLAASITQAMQSLGMQGGQFQVQLQALDEPASHGLEEVQFLVAGHAGSTPRPVGKVASGGELSRIALAIAVTTSQLGTAQTLIFDEVDAGVGGAVAETVGRLMKQLGKDRQVLAVTHLPQVAACADHHWVVSKHADKEGVASQVTPATGEQRVAEIARMLGGERLSDTTHAHAREMLQAMTKAAPKPKATRT
ncbi:MAG: DNA repair protein RecN [Burkholderiaceae bacterium]|jgi:DNA repair protein RecN (Recombination protein N)|nr:DNA repair protein RecN [Burkholderiaceae bacterium]